ncbi:class I SAM-dependent DNA methyltransferase [Cereibacter changlensis]|uniref:class I SAM-dependent DNA methyltransferase n=1 Tax=Cereibacter changlensis TaxID=402884 RepID=UPI0040344F0C
MFAEDVNLLPEKMFERMIRVSRPKPETFANQASKLFAAMRTGGDVGFEQVEWFNGGLFDTDEALPLTWEDLDDLIRATQLDWSDIDPSILGTLFERGLDPEKRSQLGAHYTDRDKIMQIVKPVVVQPLLAEWAAIRDEMAARIDAAPVQTKEKLLVGAELAARTRAFKKAEELRQGFLDRLQNYRVLDPACGSGNFLYIALTELKNIEHRANLEAEVLGLQRPALQVVGPENVLGIELNPYAAELARVSVWIGEIQWMRRNGFEAARNPILRTLTNIENRDAVLNPDGTRAEWPEADVIVGNPPFLGSHLMRGLLGDDYTELLRSAYSNNLTSKVDFVCYWFAQVLSGLKEGRCKGFGLVATNSIRQRDNRQIVQRLFEVASPRHVYSDQPWFLDGASVRVSIITGERDFVGKPILDGKVVETVSADLRDATVSDLSSAAPLAENLRQSFFGYELAGNFSVDGQTARTWLISANPHGLSNSSVLSPMLSGKDVTGRWRDTWVINFSACKTEFEASLFELPFEHILRHVKPARQLNRRPTRKENWWHFGETRPALQKRIADLKNYICTVERAKHRFFVFAPVNVSCDRRLIVFPKDCMTFLGILSSTLHEAWALAMGSTLEDRPGYNTGVCFDTFPFPDGMTPNVPAAAYAADPRAQEIAAAAARLNELRENWLNPPELVDRMPEVVPGYPDRLLPKNEAAAAELKKRTLTNLYNARPAWLDHAHRALDEAVAEAYGWGDDWRAGKLTDDEILARLFRLNQERAAAQKA